MSLSFSGRGGARKQGKAPRRAAAAGRRKPEPEPDPQEPAAEAAAPRRKAPRKRRAETATSLGARQREISVSEFFAKNRHLLGFDNPAKALLTTIKEAVDNALDACEEAGLLPEIVVTIGQLGESRFRVCVQDNGPGIVRAQVPKIFGKLLYGSKFHRLRQSRGQQGIGISAAGMYGQMTTGKGVRIISRTGPRKPAHEFLVQVDTRRNEPKILRDETMDWEVERGTLVEIELEGTYRQGRRSVDDYLAQTAVANPHAAIRYRNPKGETIVYERQTKDLPAEAAEIQPHPHGIELGTLMHMLHETRARNLRGALQADFSRVSGKVADEILEKAGLQGKARPSRIASQEAEKLYQAIRQVKIMNPPTSCLSPIGEEVILKGLTARFPADFHTAVTRPPAVYRGNPFQVEVGLAYGGGLPADELADVYRLANRVPLLYQQGACAITKAVVGTAWKNYTLTQSRGALPTGPLAIVVHIASVWVPFTSESKEAIASYPEIIKEIRLGLQECGRKLGIFLRRRRRVADEEKKRSYIDRFIPHIGDALQEILGLTKAQRERAVSNLDDVLTRSRKL
jgi:DNA topoisomerase-6 subunit B